MPGHDIIAIGASAGGVEALTQLVGSLPADFPGTLFVVLHLPAESPSLLAQILTRSGPLDASQPRDGEQIRQGHIYVAQPDYHLLVEQGHMRVVRGPRENRHRPAIDPLFRSAARAYGQRVIGVVLTGMLDDGTAGLMVIKRRDGLAVVQDPREALYPGMPRSACEHVRVDYCVTLSEMGPLLARLVHEPAQEEEARPILEELDEEVRTVAMETDPLNTDDQVGKPSVFSCPECGGVLWEIQDGNFLRFRCRTGHAFSAESALAEQTEVIDKALWNALKTLEEKANLSRRMSRQAQERGRTRLEQFLKKNMQEAEHDAQLLRQILLTPPLNETEAQLLQHADEEP